ncbi:hypothetical protein F7C95_09320 [Opitutia bacterium ISCC 51]|nr:hypothetical protein F7C95_09320 [Opitutae bacterium ISCC 51]QXD30120.1 hypothetical protein GA003_09265 [Opitutae bacterium ISCC 52]
MAFAQSTGWLLIEDTKVAIGPFLVKDYLEADAEFGVVDLHVPEFQQHYRENSEFRDPLYRLYLERRSSKRGFEYLLESVDILSDLLERKIEEAN